MSLDQKNSTTEQEEIRCIGCGAILQSQDANEPGYLPASALAKIMSGETENVYCQRCFRLRHYNEIMPVHTDNDDFLKLLSTIGNTKNALVVNVVDLFDFDGSVIPSLPRFIGDNKFILVGNKIDLFPQNTNQKKVKDWLRQQANKVGLFPEEIFLVSAKRKTNIDDFLSFLAQRAGKKNDIYFVGTTNVGKSTLVNSIIAAMGDVKDLITTSRFPGTTLDRIEIPLEEGNMLIDTPGIISPNQLAHFLDSDQLELISPQKRLKPVTFQLQPGQTIFLAGIGRIDFVAGQPANFVVYADQKLYLHRTKTENADAFYEKHIGELLTPPRTDQIDEVPALVGKIFKPQDKSDLIFGGIGFITVPGGITVKTYTPNQIGLGMRRAII